MSGVYEIGPRGSGMNGLYRMRVLIEHKAADMILRFFPVHVIAHCGTVARLQTITVQCEWAPYIVHCSAHVAIIHSAE